MATASFTLSIPVVTFLAYNTLGAAADQRIADLLKLQLAQTAQLYTNAKNADVDSGDKEARNSTIESYNNS